VPNLFQLKNFLDLIEVALALDQVGAHE